MVVAFAAAEPLEGVSLLQMQASRHAFGTGSSLPDPEHKSSYKHSGSGHLNVEVKDAHDFKCNGGNGNWVWVDNQPDDEWQGKGRSDLTENTTNIQKLWCRDTSMFPGEIEKYGGQRCHVQKEVNVPGSGWTTPTYTEHGPLRDEKDCFARARINWACAHFSEDLKYGANHLDNLGLWYKPRGFWGDRTNGTCYCGKVDFKSMGTKVHVQDYDAKKGFWFCQLSVEDFAGVDENTPTDLTPSTTTTTTTTTTTVEVCDAAVGIKRGTDCPAGSVRASSARLCELGAQSAGFQFVGSRPTNSRKSHMRPCGCWANLKGKKTFYNTFTPCAEGGRNNARDAKHAAPLCCKV